MRFLIFVIVMLIAIQAAAAQVQIVGPSPMQRMTPTTQKAICYSDAELWNEMEACKKQGMDYETYIDQNRCKQVRCIEKQQTRPCPTEKELESNVMACKRKNMDYEYYSDTYGCRQVRCKKQEITCPTKEQLDERVKKCKEAGLEPYYYTNDMGCRMVNCRETPQEKAVSCKKTTEGRCIIIRCEDGYAFNSCTFCPTIKPVKEKIPETETVQAKRPEPVKPEPGKTVSTLRKCINEFKDERTQIDDEVVWSRCRDRYESAAYDFDPVRACIEDMKGDAAIDDEVVWNRCKTSYPLLAGSMAEIQKCIEDTKKGYAAIDDEVVWSKCQAHYKKTAEAMDTVQKCVQDMKKKDIMIDDEVVWSKCAEACKEGKLSPQPDPPGSRPGMQKAQEGGVLTAMGNFFKGLFK